MTLCGDRHGSRSADCPGGASIATPIDAVTSGVRGHVHDREFHVVVFVVPTMRPRLIRRRLEAATHPTVEAPAYDVGEVRANELDRTSGEADSGPGAGGA